MQPSGCNACSKRATRLTRPKSSGVERSIARSDDWRVSQYPDEHAPPQRSLPDSSVRIKLLMICSAVWVGSVEKMALGGRLPEGSRVSTQRIGNGSEP